MISRIYLFLLFYLIASIISLPAFSNASKNKVTYTYVLVHGATGGGWDWKGVDTLLTNDKHQVFRPTLTGLGEKLHLANSNISLKTHIDDIVNLILFERLNDVVLVGHSYGGMVITGVMDRIPDRIAQAIFLDAAVPMDGMSAIDLWGGFSSETKIVGGFVYFPWVDINKPFPRDVPQPLNTFTEPVSFKNPKAKNLPAAYVAFVAPDKIKERSANDPSWKHAKERHWKIYTLNSDHNAQRSHPNELVALLEKIPASQ